MKKIYSKEKHNAVPGGTGDYWYTHKRLRMCTLGSLASACVCLVLDIISNKMGTMGAGKTAQRLFQRTRV